MEHSFPLRVGHFFINVISPTYVVRIALPGVQTVVERASQRRGSPHIQYTWPEIKVEYDISALITTTDNKSNDVNDDSSCPPKGSRLDKPVGATILALRLEPPPPRHEFQSRGGDDPKLSQICTVA